MLTIESVSMSLTVKRFECDDSYTSSTQQKHILFNTDILTEFVNYTSCKICDNKTLDLI